nr:hypothetical protein [Candidatus Njordarchaeota archaeon]
MEDVERIAKKHIASHYNTDEKNVAVKGVLQKTIPSADFGQQSIYEVSGVAGVGVSGRTIKTSNDRHYHEDISMEARTYGYYNITEGSMTAVYGSFSTDGNGINFFICDKESYDALKTMGTGLPNTHYCYQHNVRKGTFEFQAPEGKKWCAVLDNRYSIREKKDCHIDIYWPKFETAVQKSWTLQIDPTDGEIKGKRLE